MGAAFLQYSLTQKVLFLILIFFSRSIALAGGFTWFTRCARSALARRIVPREVPWSKIRHDIFHGAKILVLDSIVVAGAIHFGVLQVRTSFDLSVLLTFLLMFIWLEMFFYYSHRLLHHPRFFWIHRHHHEGNVTNPWTSLSFSIMERLVLLLGAVGVPAILSQIFPGVISMQGFSLYFLVNYILNVNAHLNTELMPTAVFHSPVGEVVNTATHHSLHHLRYRGNFGLFTRLLDRVHSTEFGDYKVYYETVYAKID
jgi:sterol desaturase/sphingolipid hydroxylase (fatty acid hydroxylase superfamily)